MTARKFGLLPFQVTPQYLNHILPILFLTAGTG